MIEFLFVTSLIFGGFALLGVVAEYLIPSAEERASWN